VGASIASLPPIRALVTGCAGFIGSHLTESLLESGDEVVGVDCFNDNYGREQKRRNLELAKDWDGFDFVPLDLARGELAGIVDGCDVVFHLAAEPGVRASWGRRFESYVRNNLMASQHLLEAAKSEPERRFVYASSSSIYGDSERRPTPENAIPAPLSPYGVTKLGAEHLCRVYHENWGLAAVSLRYFSVFGPRQRPDMAFTRFCCAALAGDPIEVYGDGHQTRDFTFVEDIVRATRSAAISPAAVGNAYNVGGGAERSVRNALAILEGMADQPLDVHYLAREPGDVRNTSAATELAERDLGFKPQVGFEDGLRRQFSWAESIMAAR